jgi:hypothetical protein
MEVQNVNFWKSLTVNLSNICESFMFLCRLCFPYEYVAGNQNFETSFSDRSCWKILLNQITSNVGTDMLLVVRHDLYTWHTFCSKGLHCTIDWWHHNIDCKTHLFSPSFCPYSKSLLILCCCGSDMTNTTLTQMCWCYRNVRARAHTHTHTRINPQYSTILT